MEPRCDVCEEGFKRTRRWQRFCSKSCRNLWYNSLRGFIEELIAKDPKMEDAFKEWLKKRREIMGMG